MEKQVERINDMKLFIDATGCVVGRLSSYIAKQALLGKEIIVVNVDKAIISGKKQDILAKFINRIQKGRGWQKGPYWPRKAEMIMRRIIRGMLPWKKARGREAFKRIKCYKGLPSEIEEIRDKSEKPDLARYKKEFLNFITLGDLEMLLRSNQE